MKDTNLESIFQTIKNSFAVFMCTLILSTFQIFSLNNITVFTLTFYFFITAIFSFYIVTKIKNRKLDLIQKSLCLFFSIIVLIGKSFDITKSFELFNHNLIFTLISICTYFYIISKLFILLDYLIFKNTNDFENNTSEFQNNIEKSSFKLSLIFIIAIWSIYIFALYPGILSPDTLNEIKAFFNISSEITENTNLINSNIHWTTQHSILHTFNLGIAVKFANFIGNSNLGFFLIYTLPQVLFMTLVFAYSIKFMANQKMPTNIIIGFLIAYLLIPMYPFYALTTHKTVYYNLFIMIFILLLFDYIKNYSTTKYPLKKLFLLILVSILATLFRNEGRYIILISLLITLLVKNINKFKIIISILSLIIFLNIYENLFITQMQITKQNNAAYLSIPFQQMARYTFFYKDELSNEDKKIIDKVINYDTLTKEYNPQFVDTISTGFNKYATNEELKAFLKIWLKHLIKHPICYLEAFIHHTYTFYYPTDLDWYIYDDLSHISAIPDIINLSYSESTEYERNSVLALAYIEYYCIPGIRYMLYNGTHFWILLIASYYIIKNNLKYIVPLIPLYLVFLVCLIGPSNWYRYSLPITFSIPLVLGIAWYSIKNKRN